MQNQGSPEGSGLRDELRGDAGRVTDAASARLQAEADGRKQQAASQARNVSSALESAAGELGSDAPDWIKSALQQGARSIEQAAQAIEGKDSRQLAADLQQFARQRPGSFLAGCALLGFAASRIFKAGGSGVQNSSSFASPEASSPQPQVYDPYDPTVSPEARPMMRFADAGGAATPVVPQNGGTLL